VLASSVIRGAMKYGCESILSRSALDLLSTITRTGSHSARRSGMRLQGSCAVLLRPPTILDDWLSPKHGSKYQWESHVEQQNKREEVPT